MIKNYPLILIAFLCFCLSCYGQVTIGIQDFENTPATPTLTYSNLNGFITTGTGPVPNDDNFVSGSHGFETSDETATVTFAAVDASAYTNIYFTCRLASFGSSTNGADGADEVYVEISDDGGTTWSRELEVQGNNNAKWSFDTGTATATTTYDNDNTPTTFTPAGGGNRTSDGYSTMIVDGLPNVNNLRVRLIINNNNTNEDWVIDDAEILGTISTAPNISVSSTSINSLDYAFSSGPSVPQFYQVSGVNLTPASGNITVTAPTNFSISKTIGGTYTNTLTYNYTGGTLVASDVFVRLNAGLSVGNYGSSNISNTGGGATATNVAVSGEVTPLPPSNDDCSSATNITIGAAPISGTLTNASPTSGNSFSYQSSKNDVWYSFTPTCTGTHTVTLSFTSGPDIDFDIFPSVCPTSGTAPYVAHGTGTTETETATFNAGTTYSIRVIDYDTNASNFNIGINAVPPVVTTQPANITRTIPIAGAFTVASSATPGATYQWEVSTNGGSNWNPAAGATATNATYNTGSTDPSMNGYQYRCIVTNACLTTTSNAATLTLTNDTPNNATGLAACISEDSIDLSWNASTGSPTPTGYIVFAQPGATIPTSGTPGDASSYTSNSNYTLATTYGTLGRVVYKGNATSATITGLTNLADYTFKVVAYFSESLTGWATAINNSGSWDDTYTIGIQNATITGASVAQTSSVITWTNPLPTSCYEVLIIANQGSNTALVPTGDGTAYNANSTYSGPDSIIFKGNATTTTVTGLTEGLSYCYTIFIRNISSNDWSSGVSICQTTGLSYCNSSGGTSTNSGILNVTLNTIDNTSGSTNAYSDFSIITTTVVLGEQHNLSVNVNTGGNYTSNVKAWIDWNRDGSFNNSASSNEVYELGTTTNTANAQPSLSPITVSVPTNAATGNVRMRVSSKSDNGEPYATPCEDFSFGEVEDYIINVVQPSNAEINVKGNNITIPHNFNDAANGGLNQTLYGTTNVGSPGPVKTYSVENIGAANLNLTGSPRVQIIGAHAGDFTVQTQPAASVMYGSPTTFSIQFFPSADGVRTATVSITNSDSDENPYLFNIQGSADCITTLTSAIWPTEGPENTEVTITSATDLTGATATINGLTMPIVSSIGSELVVSVPPNAADGNITVTFSTGCSSVNSFDVLDNLIGGCDTTNANTLNELFISEITDAENGSSSYIEIYNGTPNTVNLGDYRVNVYNNGNSSPSSSNNLSGNLASGGVYVITIGTTSCTTLNNLSVTPNQTFGSSSGINFNNDSSDAISLNKISTNTDVDIFGVYESDNWANGLGIGVDGVNFRRKNNTSPLPNPTEHYFDINEWDIIDWNNCGDSDYVDIGTFDFSTGVPPSVSVLNAPVFDCTNTIQLSITGMEGVPFGLGLTYQWYYLAPNAASFVAVPDNADFDNVMTDTLDIVNALGYNDYQFYCEVREDDATCYTASNATKVSISSVTWDGNWTWNDGTALNTPPTLSDVVILASNYSTANSGLQQSFDACNLIINDNVTLTINNGHYVRVENNLTVNNATTGGINIEPQGSFVQINDSGSVSATTPASLSVNKETAFANNAYEYTYWSSPVVGETVGGALADSDPNRRYWFNAQNYLDSTYETNNDGATNNVAGVDDIDDDNNDWQAITNASTVLNFGLGYATAHDPSVFNSTPGCPGCRIRYTFSGLFNNGNANTVTIYRNDAETGDNNWNLIGNPYPSAIAVNGPNGFLTQNTAIIDGNVTGGAIDGAIFIWSQSTIPTDTDNGNQNINFSQSDYAIINGVGAISAGGDTNGDGTTDNSDRPDSFIPSGQAFFISMSDNSPAYDGNPTIKSADIVFNNAMRTTGNNNLFFRNPETNQDNKIWLNLKSDNGVFSEILIGYLQNASNEYDGMYYDAPRNGSTEVNSVIYTTIPDVEKQFAIQGKNLNSLNLDEVIPLGFNTSINVPTIYTLSIAQLEGEFMTGNSIYVIDRLNNSIHELSETDYTFTSDTGEFNNRFEIVFTPDALSVKDQTLDDSDLTITELSDGDVQIKVNSNLTIINVDIIDVTGRLIYKLAGDSSTEVYNLSQLSKAAYIAKVTLSNGQVISKKAIKQH